VSYSQHNCSLAGTFLLAGRRWRCRGIDQTGGKPAGPTGGAGGSIGGWRRGWRRGRR